jgi:hypothetical protein
VNPFRSLPDYEEFIYALPQRYPCTVSSNLVVARRGANIATVAGEILLQGGRRLIVRERLSFETDGVAIVSYGYEVWQAQEKLCWYDLQPHPGDRALAATQPHHKHIPPDIKHNRSPAPGLSFIHPNLPMLIAEIEQTNANRVT